jgi:O-antigen/teichoic acid export membrane protein
VSRTSRLLGGLRWSYLSVIVTTLTGFWLTPFLLRRLGSHEWGLWLVVTQILGYLQLLDLGIVALLMREASFAFGRPDRARVEEIPRLLGETFRFALWQLPLVVLAAASVLFFLPQRWAELAVPLVPVLVAFVATFPLRIFQATLQAVQDLAALGRIQFTSWAVGTSLTVGLVLAGWGMESLAFGWVTTSLLGALWCWGRLRRSHPGTLPASVPSLDPAVARRLIGRGSWISITQVANVFLNGTDLLVIGWLLGSGDVVAYSCTAKLVTVFAVQPLALLYAAGPALSEMTVAESRQRTSQATAALTQAVLLASGGIAVVVVAVNEAFVGAWVGADQFAGSTVTVAAIAAMTLRHLNTSMMYAIFCHGHERRVCATALAEGVVTLLGCVVLVHWLGTAGAPLALLLAGALVGLPLNLSALAREMGLRRVAVLAPYRSWALRTLALAVAGAALVPRWQPTSLAGIGVVGAAAGVLYALLLLPVALRPPLGAYLRPRLASYLPALVGPLR